MNIIQRELDSIRPYAANAKKHDATQVANVAESIRQYGFVQPIVIDKDGVIVIGHCRALAAKKLGMKEVPCVCVDDLTPEQVKALRVIDNKTNESPWDMDLLAAELPGLDLEGFEFGLNYVKNFMGYSTVFLLSAPDVAKGKVIACPVENIDLYYVDPSDSEFAKLGLEYRVEGETNLIGFHAQGAYHTAVGETYAIMGMKLWAEYLDGIAIVTYTPAGK